jgi:hypothetical protein
MHRKTPPEWLKALLAAAPEQDPRGEGWFILEVMISIYI